MQNIYFDPQKGQVYHKIKNLSLYMYILYFLMQNILFSRVVCFLSFRYFTNLSTKIYKFPMRKKNRYNYTYLMKINGIENSCIFLFLFIKIQLS